MKGAGPHTLPLRRAGRAELGDVTERIRAQILIGLRIRRAADAKESRTKRMALTMDGALPEAGCLL